MRKKFNEIVENYINGNIKDSVKLLDDLGIENFSMFIEFLNDNDQAIEIFKSYFNIKSGEKK